MAYTPLKTIDGARGGGVSRTIKHQPVKALNIKYGDLAMQPKSVSIKDLDRINPVKRFVPPGEPHAVKTTSKPNTRRFNTDTKHLDQIRKKEIEAEREKTSIDRTYGQTVK